MFKAIGEILAIVNKMLGFLLARWSRIKYEKDKKDFNDALAKGDADSISSKFDELRSPESNSVGQGDQGTTERKL